VSFLREENVARVVSVRRRETELTKPLLTQGLTRDRFMVAFIATTACAALRMSARWLRVASLDVGNASKTLQTRAQCRDCDRRSLALNDRHAGDAGGGNRLRRSGAIR
jgi:hypothetical protein